MKKAIQMIVIINFMLLSINILYGQSNYNSHTRVNGYYLGWDNSGSNSGNLDVRNDWNRPIHFFTNNIHRMRINADSAWQCGGWANQNVNGFVGISPTGFFENNKPWSMLHLDGPDNTGAGLNSNLWRGELELIKC